MTMSEATTLAVQKKGDAPAEWGDREDIIALSNRLKTMMPGDLSAQEALLLAQYSAAMDANPFRGEVYAYMSQGKLILTEGYKLLVRWARRQCQFYERYERITNNTDTIPEDAIAFRCRILRQDAVNDLARLTEAGIPDAYLILTTEAVGVVRKNETWSSKYNKPIAPPKGWTWEDVARKRALKNALNRAYGAPSPREIAQETWQVEDTLTIPEDWDTPGALLPAEAEANAKYNANRRLAQPSTRTFAESMDELGFPPDVTTVIPSVAVIDAGTGEIVEPPPEPELQQETGQAPPEATGGNGNGNVARPASPAVVKDWLTQKAEAFSHYKPPTDGQLGLMNGLLSKILGGDKERRSWLDWTWGDPSSKGMPGSQVGATLDWLKPEKDPETNEYIPHPFAVSECKMMLRQAMLDKGQVDIFDNA